MMKSMKTKTAEKFTEGIIIDKSLFQLLRKCCYIAGCILNDYENI